MKKNEEEWRRLSLSLSLAGCSSQSIPFPSEVWSVLGLVWFVLFSCVPPIHLHVTRNYETESERLYRKSKLQNTVWALPRPRGHTHLKDLKQCRAPASFPWNVSSKDLIDFSLYHVMTTFASWTHTHTHVRTYVHQLHTCIPVCTYILDTYKLLLLFPEIRWSACHSPSMSLANWALVLPPGDPVVHASSYYVGIKEVMKHVFRIRRDLAFQNTCLHLRQKGDTICFFSLPNHLSIISLCEKRRHRVGVGGEIRKRRMPSPMSVTMKRDFLVGKTYVNRDDFVLHEGRVVQLLMTNYQYLVLELDKGTYASRERERERECVCVCTHVIYLS